MGINADTLVRLHKNSVIFDRADIFMQTREYAWLVFVSDGAATAANTNYFIFKFDRPEGIEEPEPMRTLINHRLVSAGRYKYTWQVGEMPAGIYFYRLSTRRFTQTRRMLLVR